MLDQYTKEDSFDKNNYRQVSIWQLLSKVYERVIYEQASNYFETLGGFCVDLEKHIVRNMPYLNYYLHGKTR